MVAMHEVEVISVMNDRSAALLAAAADLDECDGYVVLVFDPETGELDAHGPYEGVEATLRAEEMRQASSTTTACATSSSASRACTGLAEGRPGAVSPHRPPGWSSVAGVLLPPATRTRSSTVTARAG